MIPTFRPLGELPPDFARRTDRKPGPFFSSWVDTMILLEHEIDQIGATGYATPVTIDLAVLPGHIRRDGQLKSDAHVQHPGVIVSFEGPSGPMRLATDRFDGAGKMVRGDWVQVPAWQMNLRAIALGLEALRRVDRYGISSHAEQYRGFAALGSGVPMPAARMTSEQAASILKKAADAVTVPSQAVIQQEQVRRDLYRIAVRTAHPDSGGDTRAFQELQEAWKVLNG